MTPEQEHIMTILSIKHGGWESVVDMWLHREEDLTVVEFMAVDAWLNSEQTKPIELHNKVANKYEYLSVLIDLDKD